MISLENSLPAFILLIYYSKNTYLPCLYLFLLQSADFVAAKCQLAWIQGSKDKARVFHRNYKNHQKC